MKTRIRVKTDSHGEVTVETRGKKGIYCVSFYHEGSHVRRSLKSSNKTRALENLQGVLREYVVKKSDPSIVIASSVTTGRVAPLTLTEGLTYYLDSLRNKNCSTKDVQQAETRITAFIDFAHSLGITNFESVLPIHADAFYRGLIKGTIDTRGKKKKHVNTVIGYFRFTKAAMEYLETRSLISANPWRKVNFQRVPHKKTPKPKLKELVAILELVEPEYCVAATALAFLGCREEALLRIKPHHVKLKDEYISVKPPPHRSKTEERNVPIHPRLMKVLEAYKKPRSRYYFCTQRTRRSKGGTKMKANNLNNAIQRAAKKAGFAVGRKADGIVAHSFRGFFKSHCIKQGIPREVVDIWQGHRSDSSVGTRHYFDLEIEESIGFMKKVDFGSY